MRVLFIYPSIGGMFKPSFHAGIASVSAVLRESGHETQLFSLSSWKNKEKLVRRIKIFNPQLIGFTSTASTFPAVMKTADFIKKRFRNIKIICGGVHVTIFPEALNDASSLDGICLGEGEYAMAELAKKLEEKKNYLNIDGFWFRKNGKIIKNEKRPIIKNLDDLPFSDREIFAKEGIISYGSQPFDYPKERGLEFIFSRGCPFECSYCSNHALKKFYGRDYIRYRSPKKAVNEIRIAVEKYMPDYLQFHDDIFGINEKWLKEFLIEYRKSEIDIPFNCNLRPGLFTKETLKRLKNAGCRGVLIGLESGDTYIRNKILNRKMTNKQIIEGFRLAKEVGLETFAFCMMGIPEETRQRFLNTIKLIGRIQPDSVGIQIFYPYPGTQIFNLCSNRELFSKKKEKYFTERKDTILNLPSFQRQDILYFFRVFYTLIDLSRPKMSLIKDIHRKIRLRLLSQPPSSYFFNGCQFLFKIDLAFLRLYRLTRFNPT